jgi:hypothetical protein
VASTEGEEEEDRIFSKRIGNWDSLQFPEEMFSTPKVKGEGVMRIWVNGGKSEEKIGKG